MIHDRIELSRGISIPLSEIDIRFVRSSGPGGQHVNKTSTQAEISFDLAGSPSIPGSERTWLRSRLASKLDTEGKLQVTSQAYRSQLRNREDAIEKLIAMLNQALQRPKKRRPTRPTRGAKESRLRSKKLHGERKALRTKKPDL
jgi:ribosome-associated protein